MSRFLFVSLAVVLVISPAAPIAAQPADSTAITDSLQAALDRFERAEPPTAADSAALRRWADSLRVKGKSLQRRDPTAARGYFQESLRGHRPLSDSVKIYGSLARIGFTHQYQSQYDRALEKYERALAILRDLDGREGIAPILLNVASVRKDRSQYDEALDQYQEALRISRDLGNRKVAARSLINIGDIYEIRGRPEEARARYEEALAIERELEDRRGIATALRRIGGIYENQNQYEEALDRYREALQISQRLGDPRGTAQALNSLGNLQKQQGRYDKGLARYRRALQIYQKIGDRQAIAEIQHNIGNVYRNQGQYNESLTRYQESLETLRELGSERGVAIILTSIGNVHEDRNENGEALDRYREALEIFRDLGVKRGIQGTLTNIGIVQENRGQYEKALVQYRTSNKIARRIGDQSGIVANLVNIGSNHLETGAAQTAADTLSEAARLAERFRLNATSPNARRSLLSRQIEAYQVLTTAFLRSGQPDSALHSVEQARARLLADRLAGTATGDTTFALPSVAELRGTLSPNEAALLYANADTEEPLAVVAVTRDSAYARELPDSTIRAGIENEYPIRFNRLRQEDDPLREALASGTSREPGTTPSLAEIVRLYRYDLTREQSGSSMQNDLAQRLHDLLLEPVADVIADKNELTVVPTGALGYLPFETLQDPAGTYLVEDTDIRYAQSLTVRRQLQERDYERQERPLLALGGAAYEPDPAMNSSSLVAEARGGSTRVATEEHASTLSQDADRRVEQGKSPRPTYQQLGYRTWADLPGTEEEVTEISSIMGPSSTVVTGPAASEDTVRTLSENGQLSEHRYVHFATHGVAVPETPKLSALVLSQTNTSDSLAARDGYLTMEEIADLEMQADVAVLSACQTGLGKVVAGEGVVSLSHAFLRAGANATLVSQWKVLDESTRQFMTAVYRRAKNEDTSFAEAVTETKRAFVDGEHGEKNTDPLRWAPFVYYGRE